MTQTSTQRAIAVRKRADLHIVQTNHRHETAFVVKDPVAMTYHRLRVDEHFVLCSLDGKSSLQLIADKYNQRFAPQRVRAAEINQLVLRFSSVGLLISDGILHGETLLDRRWRQARQRWLQHISGLLLIRFPGIDPEPLLRRLYPICRPLLGWAGLMVYIALVMSAALIVLVLNDRLAAELPAFERWLRFENVLTLAAVMSVSKVLHELGHAVACKHFGGECHQIGPMLMVCTPALYCDTSDSWLLPTPWQRVAVGAAGMAVEVGLAAGATLVWWASGPGLLHAIAIQVMIVCSISTFLFNANPLLRYDGYYILSDLFDTPNLGERSRRLFTRSTAKILFGVDSVDSESAVGWGRFAMLSYALLAFIYRWTLTILIFYMVTRLLRPLRLESLGWMLAGLSAGGMVWQIAKPIRDFLIHPGKRRKIRLKRSLITIAILIAVVGAGFIPFPRGISFSGRIIPADERSIFIVSAGQLTTVVKQPGDRVVADELIATLSNSATRLEYNAAVGRYESQLVKLEAIRSRGVNEPETLRDLPSEESMLQELRKQRDRRMSRVESLQIRSPAMGRLLAGPSVATSDATDPLQLVNWTGTPTQPLNEGCWLQPGTELMSVQVGDQYDAVVVLSQSEVQQFALGAAVRLFATDRPAEIIAGEVTAIHAVDYDVRTDSMRRDDPTANESSRPLETSYSVRVRLRTEKRLIADIPCEGRIAAAPSSVIERLNRALSGVLRFR